MPFHKHNSAWEQNSTTYDSIELGNRSWRGPLPANIVGETSVWSGMNGKQGRVSLGWRCHRTGGGPYPAVRGRAPESDLTTIPATRLSGERGTGRSLGARFLTAAFSAAPAARRRRITERADGDRCQGSKRQQQRYAYCHGRTSSSRAMSGPQHPWEITISCPSSSRSASRLELPS
jgi:hypothetical protein